MPSWVTAAIIYGAIVLFWAIIFAVAVTLTRRSLRGVGEPLAEEAEQSPSASANGRVQGAQTTSAGSATTGGAHS